eukprot:GHRR01001687.1.p1 GENE.GHRR01001687.1~~GHRR01001687.1.p1  ORF type:complete len:154 (-),score=13.75 GHRR01001687.1:315-776(-)
MNAKLTGTGQSSGSPRLVIGLYQVHTVRRRSRFDLDSIPGPWQQAVPVLGNVLECLRPDFHRVILKWADAYGGICRVKFLWKDALVVTDPAALAAIMGRGEGAMDKAAAAYAPINRMCDPHGSACIPGQRWLMPQGVLQQYVDCCCSHCWCIE